MHRKLPLATTGLALLLATATGLPALAQNAAPASQSSAQQGNMNPADNSTYATGAPLQTKSKEGFWGHLNPFARKKWVRRQLDPVKGRLNELDQLQAKNANDIRDLDAKTATGIHNAQTTADQANQTATTANSTAGQAQQMAQQADQQNTQINTTVAGLDQYQKVSDTELRFHSGQTRLNARAKQALDQVAMQLQGQKGYVVEIQGYSHLRGQAGITSSQHMSDAVVRYLVEEHQVPIYKIHQIALGDAHLQGGEAVPAGSTVRVSVMQNSLAANGNPNGPATTPAATPAGTASTTGPTQ